MIGAFRFFKQFAGRCYFADVQVEVVPTSAVGSGVAFDTSAQPRLPAEWLAAADRGCRDAVAALSSLTPSVGTGFQVRITQLVFTWVDTTEDAVYAASYLAVVTAVGVRSKFELYHDIEWRVRPHN